MVYPVQSLGLHGITGYPVSVECDLSGGLPAFTIVGLPDAAVNEARERVRSAVKNCGFTFPVSRITVNLAPAHVKKIGTLYDLPILVGLLAAGGQLRLREESCAFLGELSLSGQLRPCAGMLPMALAARDLGVRKLFVPRENAAEATLDQIRREEGCLDYRYYLPEEEDGTLLLVERWTGTEAQKAHMATSHMARLGQVKAQYVAETSVVTWALD